MAGYLGTKAVLLSTTAANVVGDAEISGDLTVGGAFTSQGIDDNASATAMTLDASGNVLVGKTATGYNTSAGTELWSNGFSAFTRDDAPVSYYNRKTSDGDIIQFYRDGTTVGVVHSQDGVRFGLGNLSTGLLFNGNNSSIHPWDTSTNGSRDNAIDFGNASNRWDDIYATNGTIQTSDRNEKQDIESLSDAEQRVALACKGLLRKFRWKDSVAEKGDNARIHFGIIAQDLQGAFTAEGLDAGRYAMFTSATWADEETGEERTRLGVRYPELLAFIIGAM